MIHAENLQLKLSISSTFLILCNDVSFGNVTKMIIIARFRHVQIRVVHAIAIYFVFTTVNLKLCFHRYSDVPMAKRSNLKVFHQSLAVEFSVLAV